MPEQTVEQEDTRQEVVKPPEEEEPPVWAVAVVYRRHYLDKAGVLQWLKHREERAMAVYNSGDKGADLRGAHALAEACGKLHRKVKGWKKAEVEAAEVEQLDVEAELGKLKDEILGE